MAWPWSRKSGGKQRIDQKHNGLIGFQEHRYHAEFRLDGQQLKLGNRQIDEKSINTYHSYTYRLRFIHFGIRKKEMVDFWHILRYCSKHNDMR